MSLTDKQAAFCREYLLDHNATQAAIRAGFSRRTAQEQASRLLSNVMIRREIDRLMAERSERVRIDADEVVRRFDNCTTRRSWRATSRRPRVYGGARQVRRRVREGQPPEGVHD